MTMAGYLDILMKLLLTLVVLSKNHVTSQNWHSYQELRNRVTDCVYDFTSAGSKNGTFSSPGYPSFYSANTACRYNFQGQGKERVQIIFMDLELNYPSGDPKDPYDCEDVDSITTSVMINGKNSEIGVYCGSKRPPMLMSHDNRLEVLFTTTSQQSQAKGFKAIYKFVTDFGIKAGTQDTDMVCGFVIHSETSPNGTFTSPNFPGLYPRNTECHYLFRGKQHERIYIDFPYFDVEGIPPACVEDTQSDYVEFSNFNVKLKDRKMNRFCGTKEESKRKTVKSDGNFFRVTFKSNDVYDATGFEAFYQFRKYINPFTTGKRTSTGSSGSGGSRSSQGHTSTALCFLLSSCLYIIAHYHVLNARNSFGLNH